MPFAQDQTRALWAMKMLKDADEYELSFALGRLHTLLLACGVEREHILRMTELSLGLESERTSHVGTH